MENNLVEVKLLFFAKSREIAGLSETNIKIATKISCSNLLDLIIERFKLELIRNNIILAVNEEYCEDLNKILELKQGDSIAVIPPLSGG